jgi:deoxycytidine triphosphate deaminase
MSRDIPEVASGGVLGKNWIHARNLEIFAAGFQQGSVQGASYDLRVANTKMILPDGTRIPEGQYFGQPFHLQPGDVALVSSLERIHMPPDLCGAISIKFSYASKGILMLMGMNVDPGYGCSDPEGMRLHFILANMSTSVLSIRPGEDRIAALQFFPVLAGETNEAPAITLAPPVAPGIIEDLFNRATLPLGLSFVQKQAELESEVQRTKAKVDEHVRGMTQVVMFGHFLLGTAVVGAVLSLILGWVGDSTIQDRVRALVDLLPDTLFGFLSLFVSVVAVFVLLPLIISRTVTLASQAAIRIGGRSGKSSR